MRKSTIALMMGMLVTTNMWGQIQGDGGTPRLMETSVGTLPLVHFEKPDVKALLREDALHDQKGDGPWRFGHNYETQLNLENSGVWMDLESGGKLWVLELECPDALTINLTLENVKLPAGNELYVYNPSKTVVLGKFTDKHLYNGNLGTELVAGSRAVVEYYQAPENIDASASLTISRVTYGYRGAEEFVQKSFGDAGACHMNVNCPDGTPWANQKRSTVMIVNSGGNGFCSGALINNTANDGTPYVLTANHCYSNPAAWVIRFNWESPDCSNPASSPAFSSLSGAELKARRTTSDFCLVEITGGLEAGTVPAAFNAYFAGWDRTGAVPDSTVGIHHPKGDIKKISFDDAPALATQSTVSGVTSDPEGVWKVEWDRNTTTEAVSSGSPLFDQNGRIIGQLWGGGASCANLNGNDFYGRLHTSWEPVGSDQTNQLKHWLDPTNLGALIVDGYEPTAAIVQADGSLILPKDVNGTLCSTGISPKVTLVNMGNQVMTSAEILYGYDGVADQNHSWTGTLAQYESEEIALPGSTLPGGAHTFQATIISVNGGADEVAENNNIADAFYVMENGETVTLNLTLDCYGSETSWELRNEDNYVLFHSPQYIDDTQGLVSYDFCLVEECYTFSLYDAFSDGLSGCNSGNGSFQIVDAGATVLAELEAANANFGSVLNEQVCLGDAGIGETGNEWVNVYPNPFNTAITIEAQQIIDKITLFDVSGNVMAKLPLGAKHRVVNLETVSPGVYFLKITDINGSSSMQKIVKR